MLKGFCGLKCLECGKEDCVMVRLDDVGEFKCNECSETFTADDVREHVERWTKVLKWLGTAPQT